MKQTLGSQLFQCICTNDLIISTLCEMWMQTECNHVQAVSKEKQVLWGVTKSFFTVMCFIKWWTLLVKDWTFGGVEVPWLLIRIQQSKGRANDARCMIMLSKMLKNKGRVITYQTTVPFVSKSIVAGWKNTLKLNISTTLYDFWWWNAFRKLKNTQKREG